MSVSFVKNRLQNIISSVLFANKRCMTIVNMHLIKPTILIIAQDADERAECIINLMHHSWIART